MTLQIYFIQYVQQFKKYIELPFKFFVSKEAKCLHLYVKKYFYDCKLYGV